MSDTTDDMEALSGLCEEEDFEDGVVVDSTSWALLRSLLIKGHSAQALCIMRGIEEENK